MFPDCEARPKELPKTVNPGLSEYEPGADMYDVSHK